VAQRGCKEIEVMTLSGDQLYGFYRLDKATRVTNTPSKKRRKNSHPNQGGQGGGGTGGGAVVGWRRWARVKAWGVRCTRQRRRHGG